MNIDNIKPGELVLVLGTEPEEMVVASYQLEGNIPDWQLYHLGGWATDGDVPFDPVSWLPIAVARSLLRREERG